ncbi:hypothetical protein V5F59_06795 [Xanthobacter autotrophicus DSM 431]|uniref:hypothetical protein n=1 Tax=Xanthobacter nonsaccharivorans TaxID=3119912 RepID=UPI00372A39BF
MNQGAPEAQPQALPSGPSLAGKLFLTLGLLVNAGLAALLIGISGFVFGGPEGARGEFYAVLEWSITLGICVVGPVLGLFLWRRGLRGLALAMTWLPPLAFFIGVVAVF